ncbi:gamma-glutamyl-gamma-aminobutyrate hydrolase family protein [Paraburkholderia lycopersici]|uniref:Gamma-glutamyl-gamma-aminobutyrate hydrolase PuuD (Putrescine degradation), contains GATase1-like domain n=1 Tax=Paraburkholderia lycopersici TaxID=416944 RepID=A0A1G6ZDW9_9BURK|nr:type 1 glutamine amidotransferase [Paraburkholderia lycopersici]SDE00760.1 Gamma-glutamyl-gamma-aminobutyrate hydrolase PuuD (putrescine degradation), contains GATase1-like domain [Paraburkholderia lycopersici]
MSENKSDHPEVPDGASRPADADPAGTAASSTPSAAGPVGTPPGSSPASTFASPSEKAAQRASTDAPESASTVTPAVTPAVTPGAGEPAAPTPDERPEHAPAAAEAPRIPIGETGEAGKSAPAPTAQTGPADAGEAPASAVPPPRRGAAPAGFGQAPDFSAHNPPPPGAIPPEPPRYLRPSDSAWAVFGRIIAARARQLFDRAGQRITQRTLRIGVSARIFHPEPGAQGLRGKTLQYLEESIAHWVMSRDVIVFMIPTVGHQGMLHPSNIRLRDYAKHLDGLLLQGGADVSPQTYAEISPRPEWPGDRVRDMYELELLHEFVESGKPVLGVCRGCQLINVAFGGTLYQDIATDVPTAGVHVSEHYDQHRHSITFPEGSTFSSMFPGRREAIVNSIHHQAVKSLGRDLTVEAVSGSDGLIEAVRYRRAPFVVGVQWHPEFHRAGGPELLDCTPLLDTFLRSARETRF